MRKVVFGLVGVVFLLLLAVLFGVDWLRSQTPITLAGRFETKLTKQLVEPPSTPSPEVPDSLYQRVEYDGPKGKLWGWMSRPPADQQRHPAIVWIAGGFPPAGFPDGAWLEQDPANDQSGAQYMRAGVITLYPTTRGMGGNPGPQESFLGEVSDVVSAVQWLRAQPSVDPERVYVGGHSTGGTLALLVGASTEVAGTISLGPVDEVSLYPPELLAFDPSDDRECVLRAPMTYATNFRRAVLVEGEWSPNSAAVRAMGRDKPAKNASYVVIPRADHFFYVGAMNELFAQKLAKGDPMILTVDEAKAVMDRKFPATTIESPEGWRLTVPAGYSESPGEDVAERFFKNAFQMHLRVATDEESPVNCEQEGAVKARPGECFVVESQTDEDGSEMLFASAQRGSSLFVTIMGPKSQERALLAELNAVLDTAKSPEAGH